MHCRGAKGYWTWLGLVWQIAGFSNQPLA